MTRLYPKIQASGELFQQKLLHITSSSSPKTNTIKCALQTSAFQVPEWIQKNPSPIQLPQTYFHLPKSGQPLEIIFE